MSDLAGHDGLPIVNDEEEESLNSSSTSRIPNSTLTSARPDDSYLLEGGGEGRMTNSSECSVPSSASAAARANGGPPRKGESISPTKSRQPAGEEPDVQFRTFGRATSQANGLNHSLNSAPMRKRSSTVELNGECYMEIERGFEPNASLASLEPREYRGGVGSLPRGNFTRGMRMQERLLEASLNSYSSEYKQQQLAAANATDSGDSDRKKSRSRRRKSKRDEAAMRRSLSTSNNFFSREGSNRRRRSLSRANNSSSNQHHRSRRLSEIQNGKVSDGEEEGTDVMWKDREMFT